MSANEPQTAASGGTGWRRYFVLSLYNPIIRYGAWLLFILLVVRLSFIGFKGVNVPDAGSRATNYYVAPRSFACQKPNPQFQALAEKVRNQLSPIYQLDNRHYVARAAQLRTIESRLAVAVEAMVQFQRQMEDSRDRPRQSGAQIKESPYYKKQPTPAPKMEDAEAREKARAKLRDNLQQTEEHARALLSTIAPGLPAPTQTALLRTMRLSERRFQDAFRAASLVLDEVQRWYVVETLDLGFQKDRGQGIVLGDTGVMLSEGQRVLSYVEALDLVRSGFVTQLISENFPRIKGNQEIAEFVAKFIVTSVKPNLSKDVEKSQEAYDEALAQLPRDVAVEYAQGQTIVALGETVEPWQVECIERFSGKSLGRSGLGDFMGVPVPTLLLMLGLTLLAIMGSLALRAFARRVFRDRAVTAGDYLAIGVLLVLHLALVRLFFFAAGIFALSYPAVNKGTMLTACPAGLAVMMISALLGARMAFLGLLFLVVATSLVVLQSGPELLAGNFPAYYILYMLVVSLVGIWVTRQVTRRGSFFSAGMAYAGAGALFWIIVLLIEGGQVPTPHALQLLTATIASGAVSYILLISLMPLFEYLWDYTTDSRLTELSSTEHPALKELSRRAPGTYQHSLWIATLVEEAAGAIGANPLLAKVGAYYHDLGKLAAAAESGLPRGANDSPLFFAENQATGANPHDHLSPHVSARILRKHVELSIKMIRKYRLGKKVEDIAAQHHGTSLMVHFYNKARIIAEGEGTVVDEADFRYPGPRPQSKEAALVMLADSVEAAVRALPHHTEDRITQRVRDLVSKRRTDAQLDESTLTFGDVQRVEDSFIKTLVSMYHARPEYLGDRPDEKTVRLKREEVGAPEDESDTVELDREKTLGEREEAAASEPEEPSGEPR
jgi:putative nucleotidyltransferase with HDIG domain